MELTESFEKLPLDALRKEDYMRERNEQRVEQIAQNWRPELLQPLTIARSTIDESGDVLIDGDHRRGAAQYRGLSELWCQVYVGPFSREERARLFHDLQMQRRALNPLDKYKALLAAKDPEAVGIQRLMDKHGLQFSAKNKSPGSIIAIGSVREAWRRSNPPGEALDLTLGFLAENWREREHAFDADLILAISAFFANRPVALAGPVLLDAFEKAMQDWTPRTLLMEANAYLHATASPARGGRTVVGAVRRLLIVAVNKHLPEDLRLAER